MRTTRRFAITFSVLAVFSLAVAATVGHQLEDPLKSETGSWIVLGIWCAVGAGTAIAAIVDAYIRPEGETLGVATAVAATVFAVFALLVVIGIVVGATGVVDEDSPAEKPPKDGAMVLVDYA